MRMPAFSSQSLPITDQPWPRGKVRDLGESLAAGLISSISKLALCSPTRDLLVKTSSSLSLHPTNQPQMTCLNLVSRVCSTGQKEKRIGGKEVARYEGDGGEHLENELEN